MAGKKRSVRILFLGIIFLFLVSFVSSLGVSPAKVEANFQPGLEATVSYKVFGVDLDKKLKISVEGDLAEYVKLDRNRIIGPGEFNVIFELPATIKNPGKNRILIVVEELIDEELEIGRASCRERV